MIQLSKTNDLILFTDPDFAGKKIRDTLKRYIPNIIHLIYRRGFQRSKHIVLVRL